MVPICGGGDPEDVARIKNLPIWVFHGGKDPTVPIELSQEMVDALKKAGSNVKFTIFPEAKHDSWTQAYAMPELYDWLLLPAARGNGCVPATRRLNCLPRDDKAVSSRTKTGHRQVLSVMEPQSQFASCSSEQKALVNVSFP